MSRVSGGAIINAKPDVFVIERFVSWRR